MNITLKNPAILEIFVFDQNVLSIFFIILYFFSDIRIQLNDQLRCLDGRLESQQGLLAEIQDVFKRRAEIELNYRYSQQNTIFS